MMRPKRTLESVGAFSNVLSGRFLRRAESVPGRETLKEKLKLYLQTGKWTE